MAAYYNEIDPFAAAWLRELIAAGHVAPGDVDTRSIEDVSPDDLRPYTQCHFFAGIGVWSHALRLAGWPDDRPVWTGSCPCQPFSAAGKGGGFADERHLWPAWNHLIGERRPPVVFGEQVASKDSLDWFGLVSADLEASGYAVGAADLCAAGVGAPHVRQRLYFGASRLEHDARDGRLEWRAEPVGRGIVGGRSAGRLDDDDGAGLLAGIGHNSPARHGDSAPATRLDDRSQQPGPVNGFWRASDWLYCRDGKWRPVRPRSFPLVDGAPNRVGRLRGYGNAIVPQVAATFIAAVMEAA